MKIDSIERENKMENRTAKNSRTLDMYVRLCEGKVINKSEEANRFGVDERSIQRDIDDIRANVETEHIFSPDMNADKRKALLDGWHSAVKQALIK